MKLTNILTHCLITVYCTADTGKATDAPTTGDQSQHPTDSLTSPINYDNSYIQNYNSIIQAIFKLAQDKSITLNNMIAKITEWMRLNKRNKLCDEELEIDAHTSDNIIELYSKLLNLNLKEHVCQCLQPSLELLGALIGQGKKDGFFDYERKDGVIPYGSIAEDLYVFLEMTKAKLDEITVKKDLSTKYDEIKKDINCNSDAIVELISGIDHDCKNLLDCINQKSCKDVSSLLETHELKNFCSSLYKRNAGLKSGFDKLLSNYQDLFLLDEAKLNNFFKVNFDLFYYTSSAFEALISMNVFLINFRHLNTVSFKPKEEYRWGTNWYYNLRDRSYKNIDQKPDFDIILDLASKLPLFCVKNDETTFKNLKSKGFAVDKLELATYRGKTNEAEKKPENTISDAKKGSDEKDANPTGQKLPSTSEKDLKKSSCYKTIIILALSCLIIAVFAYAVIWKLKLLKTFMD